MLTPTSAYQALQELGLLSPAERTLVAGIHAPGFPLWSIVREATGTHLHIKIADVAALPREALAGRG